MLSIVFYGMYYSGTFVLIDFIILESRNDGNGYCGTETRENMAEKKLVEAITSMSEDFAQWYTDVVKKAELIDYTSVKG